MTTIGLKIQSKKAGLSLFLIFSLISFSPLTIGRGSEPRDTVILEDQNPLHPPGPYAQIIRLHSIRQGTDWRLIASMIFVESSFQPNAISPAGARGLMQIMPAVAREHKIYEPHDPEENIRAGISHFVSKSKKIQGRTPQDSLRLSLAAYNAGLGHLRDAQRLALGFGKDPGRWSDVRPIFLLLQKREYYRKAKHGYCQGRQVVQYVDRVMNRYDLLQKSYGGRPTFFVQNSPALSQDQT